MENRPDEQKLKVGSFSAHASRGIIRDRRTRRRVMAVLLLVAVVMAICGATVFDELLNVRERTVLFVVYWFACAWLTITVLLLAMFDLLMVRAQGRAAERQLRSAFKVDEDER
jgi:hypothetical protein